MLIVQPGVSRAQAPFFVSQFGADQLSVPLGVSWTHVGTLLVADVNHARVLVYTADGALQNQFGTGVFSSSPGSFWFPTWATEDAFSNIFVSDYQNRRIVKIAVNGGPWPLASTRGVYGIAANSKGEVFVCDHPSHSVLKFSPAGALLKEFGNAASGSAIVSGPMGLAIDTNDDVYVTDDVLNKVFRFSANGDLLGSWGTAGSAAGQLDTPTGIAFEANGDIDIVDKGNNRIERFRRDGTFVLKWGSAGTGPGQFTSPTGIAVSPAGFIYVSDSSNNRIEKFGQLLTGVRTTTWGRLKALAR